MQLAPRQDHEYLEWVQDIDDICRPNMATDKWKLNTWHMDQLASLLKKATEAYQANSKPATRNHYTAETKQLAFANLKRFMSGFINYLESWPSVPDDAIAAMKLRPRHPGKHDPIPVPTETPDIETITGQHHEVTVYVSTLQLGQPTEAITNNRKHHGFLLKWKLDGWTEWKQEIHTRKHKTLLFENDAKGKTVTVQAAWVNPRLQPGPWSDELKALVN